MNMNQADNQRHSKKNMNEKYYGLINLKCHVLNKMAHALDFFFNNSNYDNNNE